MVDLLMLLIIVAVCVSGAELTRHTCRRQLMAPVPARPAAAELADRAG